MNFKFFFRILTCFFCIGCVLLTLPVSGQRLRLLIGEYECSKNADCDEGWCDIDTHVCRTYPTCPELPECGDQNEVNGRCVECISNADCADSHRPYCNMGTFTCQTCPGDKPFWNGNECEACPAGTSLEGGVCACPSDKPYRVAACIGCESNKIFVSEHNACECPSDLPNWNASAKVCSPACTNGYLWSGTACVECLTNADCKDTSTPVCNSSNACEACSTSTPYWNTSTKRCEACPTGTPYWNASTKKCEACPTSTPVWNTSTKKCEACPTSTPVWNTSTKKCEACSTSTPVWNTATKKCEACPSKKPHWNGTQCVGVFTVTWRNIDSQTTQTVYEGDSVEKKSVSWGDLAFNYWANRPGGSAVSFPMKISSNTTFYAYYKAGGMSQNHGEYALNKCGGSRLGSENTVTSKTFSRDTKGGILQYRFQIKLRSAWNNDGYNCNAKQGNFYWTVDGKQGSGTPTTTQCTWLTAGNGGRLYIAPYEDWSKYYDVVWRAQVMSDLYKISYPY